MSERSQQPEGKSDDLTLRILGADLTPLPTGQMALDLQTTRGGISGVYHPCAMPLKAVLWVWGATGGLDGPAGAIYPDLGDELTQHGIASLRLDYRRPGVYEECVMDALAGISFLKGLGTTSLALVGHSFGGAVVITAGSMSPLVKAVVALSSQTYGAHPAPLLSPRPLLLVHGAADRHLTSRCSEQIYSWAKEPKDLIIYPTAGHSLWQCKDELRALLHRWLVEKLG